VFLLGFSLRWKAVRLQIVLREALQSTPCSRRPAASRSALVRHGVRSGRGDAELPHHVFSQPKVHDLGQSLASNGYMDERMLRCIPVDNWKLFSEIWRGARWASTREPSSAGVAMFRGRGIRAQRLHVNFSRGHPNVSTSTNVFTDTSAFRHRT
jgi:hypothetical protein